MEKSFQGTKLLGMVLRKILFARRRLLRRFLYDKFSSWRNPFWWQWDILFLVAIAGIVHKGVPLGALIYTLFNHFKKIYMCNNKRVQLAYLLMRTALHSFILVYQHGMPMHVRIWAVLYLCVPYALLLCTQLLMQFIRLNFLYRCIISGRSRDGGYCPPSLPQLGMKNRDTLIEQSVSNFNKAVIVIHLGYLRPIKWG